MLCKCSHGGRPLDVVNGYEAVIGLMCRDCHVLLAVVGMCPSCRTTGRLPAFVADCVWVCDDTCRKNWKDARRREKDARRAEKDARKAAASKKEGQA